MEKQLIQRWRYGANSDLVVVCVPLHCAMPKQLYCSDVGRQRCATHWPGGGGALILDIVLTKFTKMHQDVKDLGCNGTYSK